MRFGCKIYRTHTCHDSFAWAKEHLNDAPDGAVFLADELTNAQGRQGRSWSIYPGQLLLTFILKPPALKLFSPEDIPIRLNQLNMALSLGILAVLKPYGAGIKWPNDFIINNKKIGGVLLKLVWYNQTPQALIVGIGLNINNIFDPVDPLYNQATSLHSITGEELNLREFYKKLLISLDAYYVQWEKEDFHTLFIQWKEAQVYLHKQVSIHNKDGSTQTGIMDQVLPYGDMILKTDIKQKIISFYQIEDIRLT